METYSGQKKAVDMTEEEREAARARWRSGEVDKDRAARSEAFAQATTGKGQPATYGTGKPPQQ